MRGRVSALAVCLATATCTIAPLPQGGVGAGLDPLPPPGFGTLRQEDVSMTLASGDLQLMVTPLEASVTRVTAPDTELRLSGLVGLHGAPGSDGTGLFLVSFYSEQPDVPFAPEEVQLISRGQRTRPQNIIPVTPSWGTRRVGQRQTQLAVYDFGDSIDLESSLLLIYQFDESTQWGQILPRIQAERARARARAGVETR